MGCRGSLFRKEEDSVKYPGLEIHRNPSYILLSYCKWVEVLLVQYRRAQSALERCNILTRLASHALEERQKVSRVSGPISREGERADKKLMIIGQ